MHPVLDQHLETIRRLCRRCKVARLSVFGSALQGDFDPERSDSDFLVAFGPLAPGEHADACFGLLHRLQDLLGRPVDLVMETALRNPYFQAAVQDHQEALYAA